MLYWMSPQKTLSDPLWHTKTVILKFKMGFFEVLTLVLVVLKLTGLIAWSWLWVLFPVLFIFPILVLLNAVSIFNNR